MENSNENSRIIRRRALQYNLPVVDLESAETVGRIGDLTLDGIMLICPKAVQTGRTFNLHLELPSEILSCRKIDFEARSLWCKPDINPQFFTAGFQFVKLPAKTMEVIMGLIVQYGEKK